MVARGSGERSSTRVAGLAVTAMGLLTLLSGCDVGGAFRGFGWPEHGITNESERMYDLWVGSVVAAFAVGFFVWGLIFWCVVRYRKRGDELPPQTRFNLPMEVLYTATPFLIVAVLFYYTAVVQTYVERKVDNPDVRVEVVAFKWNWQFNYPDEKLPAQQGGQPVSTTGSTDYIPVLVLPTERRVHFIEKSRDVIHSFWVPDMLFKRDVIPGLENQFQVTVVKEGAYVGRCAELCGAYHAMMNFEVRAVSPERFDRYIELRKQGQSTPEALRGIGEPEYAIRTKPFQTDVDKRAAG